MEKNDGKIVAVIALVIAVVALSVGFAAFADQLTISGTATVEKAADTAFEGSFQYDTTVNPTCKVVNAQENLTLTSPYNAGTVSGDTWSGISVPLTAGAYSVECTAQIINTSAYTAYLTRIGVSGGIECTSTGAEAASNTAAVCARVTGTVQVGSNSANRLIFDKDSDNTTATTTNLTAQIGTTSPNNTETVKVTITFDDNNGALVPDGDITITLPTISHDYSTVQPTS